MTDNVFHSLPHKRPKQSTADKIKRIALIAICGVAIVATAVFAVYFLATVADTFDTNRRASGEKTRFDEGKDARRERLRQIGKEETW